MANIDGNGYFTEIDGEFFTSTAYRNKCAEYDMEHLTSEQLTALGVYTEIHDGDVYHFVNMPVTYNRQNGLIKARVSVTYEGTTGYTLSYIGAQAHQPWTEIVRKDSLVSDVMNALGLDIRYGKEGELAATIADALVEGQWADVSIPEGDAIIYIDRDGHRHVPDKLINALRNSLEDDWAPLSTPYYYKQKKYAPGQGYLVDWDFSEAGETSMAALLGNDKPTTASFNFDSFSSFIDNVFATDAVKAVTSACPFVKVGYGEYQHDFSFLIFYFYDVDNNMFVASTPDQETGHQYYSITYNRYYQMSITGFSGGQPTVSDPLHVVESSGNTTLYNYWHNWDHTHSLGCISYMGTDAGLKPFTIIGQTPTPGVSLDDNYPEWEPIDDIRPVSDPDPDSEDPQDDAQKPKPIKPKPIRPTPIAGVPPLPPPDTESEDTRPSPPPVTYPVGLCKIYELNSGECVRFGNALWKENTFTELKKMWANDPLSPIISFHELYVNPTNNGTGNITLGYYVPEDSTGPITVPLITQRYQHYSFGQKHIDRRYNDIRDFQCSVSIYLPFIGIKQLDIYQVLDASVFVDYYVDVMTGDLLCCVNIDRDGLTDHKVLYQFTGNCAVNIPLTAADKSRLFKNVANIGMKTVGAIANGFMGNVAGVVNDAAGIVNTGLDMATSHQISVEQSGNLGSNVGAMGFKRPYLILEWPKPADAVYREKYIGYPTNRTIVIGNLRGFNRVSGVHVEGIPNATLEEVKMIESALFKGVYI